MPPRVRDRRTRPHRQRMGFPERVSAGDERDSLLVVHCHAAERLSNVYSCSDRIRVTVRSLRIHID